MPYNIIRQADQNSQGMSTRVFQKFEPSTKRGIAKACELCDKPFSILSMDYEHQCKRCLRAVCKDCGKTKRDVYKLGMVKNPHRVCSLCTKQSDFLREYIACNKLKFGEDSPVAKKWLAKITDDEEQDVESEENEGEGQTVDKFTFEVFGEIWDAYNYSMREFVGLMTFDRSQKDVFKQVKTVYEMLLDAGHKEKLQNIVFVIIFLLCFSSAKNTFKLLQHLLLLRQSVLDSKSLLQLYLKSLKIDESEIKKISDYLNYKLKQFTSSFSVNVLSVQCSIHLMSRTMEKCRIEEVYIMFALAVEDNVKFLSKNRNSKFQCDLELVKNCKLDKYMEKYRNVANVKTGTLINTKRKDSLKSPLQDSPTKSINSYSEALQSPERKSHITDNISNKTRSIRDQLSRQCHDEERKTQKPLLVPKYSEQTISQEYGFYSHGQCYQCEKNMKRIEDLQSKLKLKEKEVQNLNFKLSFRRKQSTDDYNRGRTTTEHQYKQNEELSKLEREILQKSDQTTQMFDEMSKAKRENALLRSRIEELETTNKILKSNLSSESPLAIKSTSLNTSSQEENSRAFETLKRTLENKNKQLQELVKKNKLLSYQIQEMHREYSIKKPESNIGTKEELFKKVEELSMKVNEEQAEKLKLADQLFEVKQLLNEIQALQDKSKPAVTESVKNNKDCSIF